MDSVKKYYEADVVVIEILNTGREKKTSEKHLVYGNSFADVQHKIEDAMRGTQNDWYIKQIKESKVVDIYGHDLETSSVSDSGK